MQLYFTQPKTRESMKDFPTVLPSSTCELLAYPSVTTLLALALLPGPNNKKDTRKAMVRTDILNIIFKNLTKRTVKFPLNFVRKLQGVQ